MKELTLQHVLNLCQFFEILSGLFYQAFIARRHDDRLTRLWFGLVLVVLTYDLFWLQRVRPAWFQAVLNVPTLIYCYEKLWREPSRQIGRKLSVMALLPVR